MKSSDLPTQWCRKCIACRENLEVFPGARLCRGCLNVCEKILLYLKDKDHK